jgi:hypothetical protein
MTKLVMFTVLRISTSGPATDAGWSALNGPWSDSRAVTFGYSIKDSLELNKLLFSAIVSGTGSAHQAR